MKYVIVSDIHGCLPALEQVLEFFDRESYDMLVILGDIMNYGPRNGVPEGLDAMGIAEALNARADRIVAIRGNCDSEVDQMLLKFPMMSDYTILVDEGKKIFLTHGHVFNEQNLPAVGFDAFVYGHSHLQKLERNESGKVICNTGSITFPKGGNERTFVTYEGGVMRIRLMDGSIFKEIEV